MAPSSDEVRRELRRAGFSKRVIEAAWPEWWSAQAEGSTSATAELRYTLARRLGLSPRSLFQGPPAFTWRGETKFKSLGTESDQELAILSSFGTAVGQTAISALPGVETPHASAQELRAAVLESSAYVTLPHLVAMCWGIGIPVLHLTIFPLKNKRMHAMTVRSGDRYSILLGRESRFPAQVAYWVAHELAHVMLRHLSGNVALLEMEEPLSQIHSDSEEQDADAYALALLTGQSEFTVVTDDPSFTASQLAQSAMDRGHELGIDPAVLALCLGYSTGRWKQVFGALKIIPPGEVRVSEVLNDIARHQLQWADLPSASRDYLLAILGSQE